MVDGSIVLVAKCPIPGKSKTRLMPLLGPAGSTSLAWAMLSDILQSLTALKQSLASSSSTAGRIQLYLLYAPADKTSAMEKLLQTLNLESHWELMPMLAGDLKSSDLGAKLTDALGRVRQQQRQRRAQQEHVVFLGMDSPELPLDEIAGIFQSNKSNHHYHQSPSLSSSPSSLALLCPAHDGGYGLLSVPPTVPTEQVFAGVRWSQSLTAVSQLKALTDAGAVVRLGRLMYDIDEPADVHALVGRLLSLQQDKQQQQKSVGKKPSKDVLLQSSNAPGREQISDCPHTRKVLCELGLLAETTSGGAKT